MREAFFVLAGSAALMVAGCATKPHSPPPVAPAASAAPSTPAPSSPVSTAAPKRQAPQRMSPHETISMVVDGSRVMLVYGRPYAKKPGTAVTRKIWGGLVPYGQVWRTGADEATLLTTRKPLMIGGATIPAGAYTLFTLPEEDGSAKLIFSKDVGEWGLQYNPDHDFARVDLQKTSLAAPVDQFTMGIAKNPAGGGVIKMSWENTEYAAAFTVAN